MSFDSCCGHRLRLAQRRPRSYLPPLQMETRITCPLSTMQTFWYRRLLLKDSRMLASIEAQHKDVEVGAFQNGLGTEAAIVAVSKAGS